jgi:hypothetical protein
MSFYNNNQQAQLMAQMFQNPQGGGMPAPQPGQGGVGSGMNLGPSFGGPEGAQGVQNMPFSGPQPDFTMGAFQPGSPTGIQDLGPTAGMPAPQIEAPTYQEQDGFGQGFSRGFGKPEMKAGAPSDTGQVPTPRQKPNMGNGAMDPGVGVKAGMAQPQSGNPEDDRKRQVLIEAIMRKAFGGMG